MSPTILASSSPFPWAGEFSAALSALLWGSSGIVIARIRPPLSPGALNLGKNAVSLVCFAAALWAISGSPWPSGLPVKTWWVFLASGALGLAVCDSFLMRSLLDIGPQRMTLVFLAFPVLSGFVAMLPPFGEFPPLLAWLGMAVTLGAIGMAVLRHAGRAPDRARFRRGVRCALLAAVFQTAAVLLARYGLNVEHAPILETGVVRMIGGTAGLVLIAFFARRLGTWSGELKRPRAFAMLFVAAFFGTFLGILTNQFGVAWATHTGVAVTLNSLMPIYLMPLSVFFLDEEFGVHEVVTTVVAVGGVAMMMVGSNGG